MKLYMIEYDNGDEYEQNDKRVVGIYDNLNKAIKIITDAGFEPCGDEDNLFIRYHEDVKGECVAHDDYALIHMFELNEKTEDEFNVFGHHYKSNQ